MICASFDGMRSAAASGAYQYDTGQRLAMHGLPSPEELAGEDELLSGDLVTVTAQFAYRGDSQTQTRLALWDSERRVWLCDVPDEYLTRHRDVQVFVFCYYGADGTGERGETAYEAVFRPISRPAPEGMVTPEQIAQWEALKAEIEISMARVDGAVKAAQEAAAAADKAGSEALIPIPAAQEAAETADKAAAALSAEAGRIAAMLVQVSSVAAGTDAMALITQSKYGAVLKLLIPAGDDGDKGEKGADGPNDIELEFDEETGTLTITEKGSEA